MAVCYYTNLPNADKHTDESRGAHQALDHYENVQDPEESVPTGVWHALIEAQNGGVCWKGRTVTEVLERTTVLQYSYILTDFVMEFGKYFTNSVHISWETTKYIETPITLLISHSLIRFKEVGNDSHP